MTTQITLRHRLLLLTLLPSTLIAVALVAYFTLSAIHTLQGELHAKGLSTVRYLAPVSEYGIIAGQIEGLHGLAQATVQEDSIKAAIIVNQKGRAIAVSGRVSLAAETLRSPLARPMLVAETDEWIAFGAPVRRSLDDADLLFDPLGSASAPEVIGHVFVEFDKSELTRRQIELWQRGLAIVLFGLLALAGLAVAMADNLARPVMRLAEAIRRMSGGDLEVRVAATSSGEIGILERGFNEMAGHIQEVYRSMQHRIEEATAQLAFQARHDPLTGLLNRREFEHRLEKALLGVQAGGDEFSLLFIDLDRFKPVNDSCGHLAGDELLRQISLLFLGRLREEDTLARLGGDEFGIILSNCGAARARQVADDICGLAGAYRFIWQDKVFSIGASIGLTPANRRVRTIQDLLSAADAACQRAKESGRNQVVEQETAATDERRQEANGWAGRIAAALESGLLLVEAIPLRPLQANDFRGHVVELSGRLNEPGQPLVSLSALTDAAERYDLAPEIDRRLVETAIAALARASRRSKELHCLVPVSRPSVAGRKLVDYVATRLAEEQLDGRGLHLIFPEDVTPSQAMEFARQVRTLGCQVGLADFGGDLSSFNHLRSLQPSCVKLSRSLTRDLGGNRASTALLRAVQEITADQNIYSVADGVDELDALEQLAELGIDYAAGKAVGPCEPFEAWLEGAVMRSA